jgi:spore coat protein JC
MELGKRAVAMGRRDLLMWNYEKRLEYPINIKETNPQIAKFIMSQYGGPDGEISASLRYLSQRYAMPYREVMGVLTDIGREAPEMFHLRGLRFF